jgi:hypothetical protein
MGGAHSTHGKITKVYKILLQKCHAKILLVTP